jgi:hypothetical protein
MFNVLPGGRRGAVSENIGMAFNGIQLLFWYSEKDATQMHCITIVRVVPSVARAPAGQNSPLRGP